MRLRSRLALFALSFGAACLPAVAYAHGPNAPRPDLLTLLTRWEFDPLFIILIGVSSWLYISGVRRVNTAHPKSPFPRKRTAFFFSGIAVLIIALISPPASYDTTLFSIHMSQHLLLTMLAAPLLLLGTPITHALRAATPRVRKQVLLPMLHSRALRILTFPVISWLLFAAVMWGSHFSPLYNDSLENAWLHRFEHFLYLTAALMFWWQAIGIDPTPWQMPYPVKLMYVFLQMPQSSFLGVAIYGSEHVLYKHYETLQRTWGPSPIGDQQMAGMIMWVGGDMCFLIALGYVIYQWVKHEERVTERTDRALARERAEHQAAGAAGSQ
jgi:putative copper resistance protein D